MLLNKVEFLLMNNPIRNLVQRFVEVRRLRALSNLPKNKIVLEIGCGTGNGTKLIKEYFEAKKITAIDLDERMIRIAKRRFGDTPVSFAVQDAAALPYKDGQFDAVFDFGVIHHIPGWKDCLKGLHRILKPKGQLIIEDLSLETFETLPGRFYRKILDHPYQSMYREEEFIGYLGRIGFKILKRKRYLSLGFFRYFAVVVQKR